MEGEISNDSNVRLIRDGAIIYNGKIGSIFREKNQAKQVSAGLECGITLRDFDAVNSKMIELLEEPYPARSLIQAAALPKNVDVEIEVIAGLNENGER